ncbi:hypothetical protein KGA66_09700 [Actinocrinis puniceicyclus]|uniref:HEPN domain-containing protein n=1 Tax=Actinocrinis puniceicyclus TaxID=977794 RepID=A0A8J7WPV0_9ACTN|nr:hypothetical protein [Actinocrinis puniceicyclus]MBS2963319.1 hypothetical protein [Actinocrinis puniceicyclus]
MKWGQGRADIERMISAGELQRVPASREFADGLLDQARAHLGSGERIKDEDAHGAYVLVYDAARKALAAVLENQGLRATSRGGHVALGQAVRAQLDPPMGSALRPFERMRRRRNTIEYAPADTPRTTAQDVADDLPKARALIDLAATLLDEMSPW